MSKLLLVDGNSIINRAFYGQGRSGQLTAPDGTPTGAVYTFINMLLRYKAEFEPSHIAVAFDRKEPTFRHERYADYKANRTGMPEDLAVQMPILKSCLEALNVTMLEQAGYEADDIIGTVATKIAPHAQVYILSGDRDDFQLLTDRVWQIYPKTGGQMVLYTPESLEEEFGLRPDQIVDYKALVGDSSDNIPGVKGIGKVSAMKLLDQYDDLDTIYAHADEIKGALGNKVRDGKEDAYLSQELATIDCAMPIDLDLEAMEIRPVHAEKLFREFNALGFNSLIERFDLVEEGSVSNNVDLPPYSLQILTVDQCLDRLNNFSPETPLFLTYLLEEDRVTVIPAYLGDDGEGGRLNYLALVADFTYEELHKLLESIYSRGLTLVTYEAKALAKAADFYPLERWEDLMVTAYLLGYEVHNKTLAETYNLILGEAMHFSQGLQEEEKDLSEKQIDLLAEALALAELYKTLSPDLAEKKLEEMAEKMDYPLVSVLAGMEKRGILVDRDCLHALGESFRSTAEKLEDEIFREAGRSFNINSPKQLGQVLYEDMGITPGKKTASGNYSTAASELERLAPFYPIVSMVLDYRTVSKLDSTFIQGLDKEIASDGRIHTTFHQTLTTTGRLSSSDPNLQNIPMRDDLGRQVRKAFIPTPGYVLIDADYSQVELRILAALSEDENLLDAFHDKADIHKRTATSIFGVREDQVTPAQRSAAKTVNFSIIYGISDFGLAQDLKITRKEAKAYIESYYDHYSKVKPYMDSLIAFAYDHGYVETYFGRRRYIPELQMKNFNVRKFGERAAMNAPIQGTAADIMKLAMIRAEKAIRDLNLDAGLLVQVHDELLMEVREDQANQAVELLKDAMEGAVDLGVALPVDIKVASNWYESK